MFRSSEPLSSGGRVRARQYVKRACLFAAGLLLLWVAIQLTPSGSPHPPVFADESGTVATNARTEVSHDPPALFSFGNIAAYALLIGGAVFAFVLHRRSTKAKGGASLIEPLAELGLGQGQQLRLVRCGDEILLIGVTSQQITVLRDFDAGSFEDALDSGMAGKRARAAASAATTAAATAAASSSRPATAPQTSHFADVLRQVSGRYSPARPDSTTC